MSASSWCALPCTASKTGNRARASFQAQQAAPVAAGRARASRRLLCRASGGDAGADAGDDAIPDTLPLAGVDTDWRAFRAKLVASSSGRGAEGLSEEALWAHSLPGPEQGCLLVAHPLMFTSSQTYFFQSVILIFSHNSSGSAGLILNRPTEYLIEQTAGTEFLRPEFDKCRLYLGGDVGKDTLHLLHGVRGLEDSVEVLKGAFIGGFPAARLGLAAGEYQPEQFKVLTRYSGWGPGQLEEECNRGVWFPAAASSAFVLQHLGGAAGRQQQPQGSSGGRAGAAGGDLAPGGEAMWHQVLQLMGGEYAELSAAMSEVYRPDIMEVPKKDDSQQL